ncbi:hypothetical protein [Caulobacter sp. S45]|uniref:hypothetical protein n=1 Tax=Caulobacter sp. S45 TaxID=1641861 RepID=UPI00131C4504|nr:hypothetical protein [Caulobacter sp. S45]
MIFRAHTKATIVALFAALLIPFAGSAQAQSKRCEVLMRSPAGGAVEAGVNPDPNDYPPGAPLTASWVRWSPPASGSPMNIHVGWTGGVWDPPTQLTDLEIEYDLQRNAGIRDPLEIDFAIRGEKWSFEQPASPNSDWLSTLPAPRPKTVKSGRIFYGRNDPVGVAILSAMTEGSPLTVTVRVRNHVELRTTIDPSDTAARNALLEKTRARIKAGDPAVCKDASPPPTPHPAGSE